ncbi:NitT/TauT family transport system substrate-binding protein [Arboricoccus pini]|uniref:NitT/TauT family transport system substrate-binding protein n=1 Tax=Arboricoccus pini TaxID=1963835 RepID=A0A212S3D4_9PROT|nr:putative urea ABC transporter substrate-binding protein [Arboricoccus pini]SNB79553.1 NitT/TauT family transport system substrate-binding protein [Arboricoccus pini]
MNRRIIGAICLVAVLLVTGLAPARAAERPTIKIGWSIYVGFMPLVYMEKSGILKKWGDKYNVDLKVTLVNDYVGSINQFIGGDLDIVTVAGMDGLTMPAAGGVDTTLFMIGDYSNGNDVLLSKKAGSVKELKGQTVDLVQFSVSHYLLQRALVKNGMTGLGDVKTVNISDADIASAYLTSPDVTNVASWKPMTDDMIKGVPGTKVLFTSQEIPGEIMDVFITKTATMKAHPEAIKALAGAWYEALGILSGNDAKAKDMREVMAAGMGTDVAGFESQEATTHFFKTAKEASDFLTAASTKEIWDNIRTFSFEQGLFGQGATSKDDVGISFPDGSVLGNTANVKLRVNDDITALAAAGKL